MRSALAVTAVALSGSAILWWWTDGLTAFTTQQALRISIASAPRRPPYPLLVGATGERFSLRDLRGQVVLVNFVYSRCPTACTRLGTTFQQIARRVAAGESGVVLLTISFDPTDTPERLGLYAGRFGADGTLWRVTQVADRAELPKLLESFGVVVIPDGEGGFMHNAAIYLVDREGRIAAMFPDEQPSVEPILTALARP